MDCFGHSDRGSVRPENHDQFVVADLRKTIHVHYASSLLLDKSREFGSTHGQMMLVADGHGEGAAGSEASLIAVDVIVHYMLDTMPWFYRLDLDSEDALVEELRAALGRTQKTLRALQHGNRLREEMRTTLTVGYLMWPRLFVLHAGDSRCYVLRHQRLEQVTVDHTQAQRLIEQGELDPGQAARSDWSRVLWNVLGNGDDDVMPDVYLANLQLGDALLLCTDGLTRHVSDGVVLRILRDSASAKEACLALVEAANAQGGEDNVTVVVAYFRSADTEPVDQDVALEAGAAEPLAGGGDGGGAGSGPHPLGIGEDAE